MSCKAEMTCAGTDWLTEKSVGFSSVFTRNCSVQYLASPFSALGRTETRIRIDNVFV